MKNNQKIKHQSLTKKKSKINILDIGVGSGCIIVSILKERKNFRGTGIDLSKKCLNISKKKHFELISNKEPLGKLISVQYHQNKIS